MGPDTSRIVAEILLSGIHGNEAFKKAIGDHLAYRLVDDFFIGFEDEATARKCHDALRRALWDYNLYLNETKTRIFQAASIFGDGWKYEIDNFPVPSDPPAKQRDAVQRLLEIALQHCDARQDAQPATFFCRRLLSMEIILENVPFIRDCTLRVARDFTVCLKFAAQFVTQYRSLLMDSDSLRVIKQWARLVIAAHASRGHDLEVSWILFICGVLGLSIDKSFIPVEDCPGSPVVLALMGMLSEHSLLAGKWDDWRSPHSGEGSIANGRCWLPHYEAVFRGWTDDVGIIGEIKADPLFSKLLEAKVTFLDDSDFWNGDTEVEPSPSGTKPGIAARRWATTSRGRSNDIYD